MTRRILTLPRVTAVAAAVLLLSATISLAADKPAAMKKPANHSHSAQQVMVVRIRRGANPDLVVRLPDGTHAAIAMHLTDYAGAPAPSLEPDPAQLLSLAGLRQVVQLLEAIRQDGRWPPSPRDISLPEATVRAYD